jgi:hypothetical protein
MTDNPIAAFLGAYGGYNSSGLNAIFRPNSTVTPTKLPTPVASNNILQLSVIRESLRFINAPGLLGVPVNRGSGTQGDVTLTPVFYDQYVEDINIPQTLASVAAGTSIIHQEVGIWMVQPATNDSGPSVQRFSNIQHGVSLVAEGTYQSMAGAPSIPPVSLVPFTTDGGRPLTPQSLQAAAQGTARLPQDPATLAQYGITQAVLDDPNKLLRDKLATQKITATTVLQVETADDGVANSKFLKENAKCTGMRSTFYIETVDMGWFGTGPQIQYFQEVFLEYGGVTYPHVTVATMTHDPLPTPVVLLPAPAFI